ncbi:MAG: sigma-70 family RNA polymerase sigma factor [Actinomycetota bacterium]|nr:sigma-70 family RNA polymerase sigma factor [Actinomycetota bacterium]
MTTEDRAFAALYVAQFDPMVRLAVLLVDSTAAAEDLVQDVFAKLLERFSTVDDPPAWLRVAVTNACKNERRRLGTFRRHAPRLADPTVDTDRPVDELIASLRRLPYRQRAVVVLRFYLGLSEAQIAATLDVRPGTVKSSLSRALARLRVEVAP